MVDLVLPENNNYINKNINPGNKQIRELKKWAHYDWYKDGIKLDDTYNNWNDKECYEIIFNKEFINLYIKIKNKIIISPLLSRNSTIEEIKNILSIKDNIYFNQIKLEDENTLDDYDVNNMDSLTIHHNIYSSALDC